MNRLRNLWGEPVALWAAIQAGVQMMIAFGWLSGIGLDGQDSMAAVGVVLAAAAAVHLALFTHQTLLAPVVQLFQALAVLGVIYGVKITDDQSALAITFITAIFAFGHRQSTSPSATADLKLAA